MKRDPLDLCQEKVVVFDGAMGTSLQGFQFTAEDFGGVDGCNEVLVRTRSQAVQEVHASFLRVGCDVVETNTFGANQVVLAEYGIADQAYELSRLAAELAREVAADFSTQGHPRFVCGSVGPGTKLPSLGHISFQELRGAYLPHLRGLLDGGVDLLALETCQDLLQIKAAVDAARLVFHDLGRRVPLLVSITLEANGGMLLGSDLTTALATLLPLKVELFGLNCATGPDAMLQQVHLLGRQGPAQVVVMPNAGLPRNVEGRVEYPMQPAEFGQWLERFVREEQIGLVGGCCGTTPAHLAEVVARVGHLSPPRRDVGPRSAEASSLFMAVPFHQEPPPLFIGERTNANGSREFRERLLANDHEGMLAVAREQEQGGAHLLDVCVAYVGRDEQADMARFVGELAQHIRLPLVLDSTDPEVLEAALERHGGRCLINSINLEEGPARAERVIRLARRFGAALIALVIDEQGMALTVERKLAVAERLYRLVVEQHGLAPQDLVLDLLTFTVASGEPETRGASRATLDAVAEVKRRYPGVHTVLGVSNVSFGLKPALRRPLNSVMLALAVERGLDLAIVNPRLVQPLYRIDPQLQEICRRLLLAEAEGGDPLAELLGQAAMAEAAERQGATAHPVLEHIPPEQQLRRKVIDGVKQGVPELLDSLLALGHQPLRLVNEELIPAMQQVGQLFGSGQMQLPFVLQSAEVMKAAVAYLQPHMEQNGHVRGARPTLVLATVKGDVHDVGKNLVDIILSNNGYRVVNLGIKVGLDQMLLATAEHRADALGMSGLLVKSTQVMKENLAEMRRLGIRIPVLLGGAALTRSFVEEELRPVYGPDVFYCADAFEGLRVLDELKARPRGGPAAQVARSLASRPPASRTGDPSVEPGSDAELPRPHLDHSVGIPTPPYLGARVLEGIPLAEVLGLINEATLIRGQWRYRRGPLSREAFAAMLEGEIQPLLARWKQTCLEQWLLQPRAVVGYFPCHAEGVQLVVGAPDDPTREVARFTFPRRRQPPHWSLADYFRPGPSPEADLIGLLAVTVGATASRKEQELFEGGNYREYLHFHGLAVEAAEATAEWIQARMQHELGFGGPVQFRSRGVRFSFGYPACPELADQAQLFRLLEPERIGLELTETFQLVPEQSVTALFVHHPEAGGAR